MLQQPDENRKGDETFCNVGDSLACAACGEVYYRRIIKKMDRSFW